MKMHCIQSIFSQKNIAGWETPVLIWEALITGLLSPTDSSSALYVLYHYCKINSEIKCMLASQCISISNTVVNL